MKQRKTVEDYLKAVYLLQKQNGSVRGADIAAELHVSRPTVSVSLKELEKEGYLFLDGAREQIRGKPLPEKLMSATRPSSPF